MCDMLCSLLIDWDRFDDMNSCVHRKRAYANSSYAAGYLIDYSVLRNKPSTVIISRINRTEDKYSCTNYSISNIGKNNKQD